MMKKLDPVIDSKSWVFRFFCSAQSRGALLPPIQMPSGIYCNSLASTPSIDMDVDTHEGGQRRNSSGTLLSPEVDAGAAGESDGFYVLKKDSQRRATLMKIFSQDGANLCNRWLEKVKAKYLGQTVLTTEHLSKFMSGLQGYLSEQNPAAIQDTVNQLKEALNFDDVAINQLQFAVFLFHESVNDILRLHPIKPHWIFALEDIVRQCSKAALSAFELDVGDNMGPSTVDSGKSSKSSNSYEMHDVHEKIVHLRSDNNRLTQEFLESHKQYNAFLQQAIEQIQQQIETFKQISSKAESTRNDSYRLEEVVEIDPTLAQWLKGLGLHESAQKIFLSQGFTLEEVLYKIGRDDLRGIGLKAATQFRVWEAIKHHRHPTTPRMCNGISTPDNTSTV